VRELQSWLQACRALGAGAQIGLERLGEAAPEIVRAMLERRASASRPAANNLGGQRRHLSALLAEHTGNVSAVAKVLGTPRAQVYRWMKAYGMSAARFRQ
jgi:transcriptional regulator of acetoin/glycerol metabolism